MKVSEVKGNVSNLKIFKPIQYLNIQGGGSVGNITLRVRLVNSQTGRVDEIIPSMNLSILGEISSMNEGFFVDGPHGYNVNVMLHPTSAVYLSNDKYLEVDLLGNGSDDVVTVYGIESPVVDKDFVCRYNKFYMSEGELQKTFIVGDNENLIIPKSTFDEIVLHYSNGSSCVYSTAEIDALMMLKNDLVCLYSKSQTVQETVGEYWNYYGCLSMYGLDVSDVVDFTLRRTYSTTSFEVVLMDTVKE